MQKNWIGKKVLITCSNWFTGPDSKEHAAVWGTLKGIYQAKEVLGFELNRVATANWCYDLGDIIVMGCQVNYISLCPNQPIVNVTGFHLQDGKMIEYIAPNKIYIANDTYPAE